MFAPGRWEGATLVELGAGCGACGLMGAKLGARHVLLTDYPQLLPLLRRNAQRNGVADRVDARGLEWGAEQAEALALHLDERGSGLDALIGADVSAFVQSLDELAITCHRLCAGPAGGRAVAAQCYIAHHERGDSPLLLEAFAPYFDAERLELPWDDEWSAARERLKREGKGADACSPWQDGSYPEVHIYRFSLRERSEEVGGGLVTQGVMEAACRGDAAALKSLKRALS